MKQKNVTLFLTLLKKKYLCTRYSQISKEESYIIMASTAFKNRTREEIIAAFRESIRKKHEWQKEAENKIKRIHEERMQFSI